MAGDMQLLPQLIRVTAVTAAADIIEVVDGSVLWLLQYPPEGERRLREVRQR